jgi:phosphomannomutase
MAGRILATGKATSGTSKSTIRRTKVASELIISVSGLRGIVGETLTDEVVFRYAAAFAEVLPAGPAVVTRDGRANGPLLVGPVLAGL